MNHIVIDELPKLDILMDPLLATNPHEIFAEIHALPGHGVFRHPVEDDFLVVTQYAMLKWMTAHKNFQAQDLSRRKLGPPPGTIMGEMTKNHPLFINEPLHKPLHAAAFRAVGWQGKTKLESMIENVANDLVDRLLDKETIDLVHDLAIPMAARVWITILGFSQEYAPPFEKLAGSLVEPLSFAPDLEKLTELDKCTQDVWQILDDHAVDILEADQLNAFQIITPLLEAIQDAGKPQSTAGMLAAMSADAIDGPSGMISNCLYHLLSEPDVMDDVKADYSLLPELWSETVRFSPAILGLHRCPIEDSSFEDITFPAGYNILTLYAAGNQDPRIYDNPGTFDIHRAVKKPLTFGAGPRACVGRGIAKIEAEKAIAALLNKTSKIELLLDEPNWGKAGLARAIESLPVRISR